MQIGEIAGAHLSVCLPPFAFAGAVTYEGVSRTMLRTISVIGVGGSFPSFCLKINLEGSMAAVHPLLHWI